MRNYIVTGLALLTVVLNGLIGHFQAPNGITFTPWVLIITSSLIVFGTKNLKVLMISFLTFIFVASNDILIKLYSGGSHDSEGLDWIHFFLFIGLIPTFIILLIGIFIKEDEKLISKLWAIALFILLIAVHLQVFGNLGIGRFY